MASTNFMASANKELQSFNNTYTNSRYAPTGTKLPGNRSQVTRNSVEGLPTGDRPD